MNKFLEINLCMSNRCNIKAYENCIKLCTILHYERDTHILFKIQSTQKTKFENSQFHRKDVMLLFLRTLLTATATYCAFGKVRDPTTAHRRRLEQRFV